MSVTIRCRLRYDFQVRTPPYIMPPPSAVIELRFLRSRHPDGLYKNGIQRSSFIPCIDLIKSRFDVTDLDSGTGQLISLSYHISSNLCIIILIIVDYRRIPRALSHVYYHPLTPKVSNEMNKLFSAMAGDRPVVHDRQLKVWGRSLTIPESAGKIAKFTFKQLCGQPLSAADYIELTREFNTVFLLDVPKMGLNQKDMVSWFFVHFRIHEIDTLKKARRFITFIDGTFITVVLRELCVY